MRFSGRGGEVPVAGRGDAGRRFRSGEAAVVLCVDAAAEGLNFRFCGPPANYDMHWNPVRVERRIGQTGRLEQRHAAIRIVKLRY